MGYENIFFFHQLHLIAPITTQFALYLHITLCVAPFATKSVLSNFICFFIFSFDSSHSPVIGYFSGFSDVKSTLFINPPPILGGGFHFQALNLQSTVEKMVRKNVSYFIPFNYSAKIIIKKDDSGKQAILVRK